MILTQAHIPYDIAAREWKDGGFRDSYAWHKRIWEAFPKQPDSPRTFLSRLDDTGHNFRLLLLSPEPPTRPDWCPVDAWQSKTIAPTFYDHQYYRFSLLANPTRKQVLRDNEGNRKKNGKRVPISKREDLIQWICRKGQLHGFEVDTQQLKTIPRPRQHFLKKGSSGIHTATEFSGVLTVNDQTTFKAAATKGIGSAKAFGFGMLCLSPITNP